MTEVEKEILWQLAVDAAAWQQLAAEYKEACRTASHYTEKMRRADARFEELSKP